MSTTTTLKPISRIARFFLFTIRSKIVTCFVLLFSLMLILQNLVYVYGIPFTSYPGEYLVHQSEELTNLSMLADMKKKLMINWFSEWEYDAKIFATNNVIKSQVKLLLTMIGKETESGTSGKDLWYKVKNEEFFNVLQEQIVLLKNTHLLYKNIQIVRISTGVIIVSDKKSETGRNISEFYTGAFALSLNKEKTIGFGKEVATGTLNLHVIHTIPDPDNTTIGNMANIGLILHLNYNDMIMSQLYTGEEFGKSGEMVLVDQNQRILRPLKFPLADGSIAKPLEYKITAKPALMAAKGEEGITISKDYRNVPVLAAYRYLNITPELKLGMVIKRDKSEVLAPIHQNIKYFTLVGSVIIIIIIAVTYLLAYNLSQPIHALSQAALKVGQGDFNVQVPVTSSDEVGILTITFNSMIVKFANWHSDLEQQVNNRIADLHSANKELKRKNEELNEFTYISSHDLQEPLRKLITFCSLLRKDIGEDLSDLASKDLYYITDATTRMQMLVQDLLSLSHTGKTAINPQRTSLNTCANSAIKNLSILIVEAGAEITRDELPEVWCEPTMFIQLYQNLISNAIKFSNKGKPVIRLTCEVINGKTILGVKDNGIGIDPGYAEQIFAPFKRLHSREKYKGTGIGLAICRKTLERHNGRIWVESKPGEGAHFKFTINEKNNIETI